MSAIELFIEYSTSRDIKVRNILVRLNHNLARKEAHKIADLCREPYEDLEQEATIGLIRSIDKFNPNKGVAFSSYAVPYIRGKLLQYLRDKGHLIRLSQSTQTLINKGKKISRELSQELGRNPTTKEIAAKLKCSLAKYEEAISASNAAEGLINLDAEDDAENMISISITEQPTENQPVVQIDWSNLTPGELATLRRKKGDRRKVWCYLANEISPQQSS